MKRPQIVEQIRKALAQVVPDAQAILYGSEARGEARPDSDIDLLILVDGNELTVKEEDRIIAPLYDIEIETGVQINARVLLKKIWENRPFQTPFIFNVILYVVKCHKNKADQHRKEYRNRKIKSNENLKLIF